MRKIAAQSIWFVVIFIAFAVVTKTAFGQQLTKEKIWLVLDEICEKPGFDEKSSWPPDFATMPSGKKLDEMKKSCSISDEQMGRWNKVCAEWNQAINEGSKAALGDIRYLTSNPIGNLLPEEQKRVLDYYSKIRDQYENGLQKIFSQEQLAKMNQFKINEWGGAIFSNKTVQDFLEVDKVQQKRIGWALKDNPLPIPARLGSTFGAKVLTEAENKKIQQENELYERKLETVRKIQTEACFKVLTDGQKEKFLILLGKKPLPN